MADAVISVLLEQLISISVEELKEKVKLVTEVKSEVESLTSDLKAIGAVILDAERRQLSAPDLKLWLADLKDSSYDVETLLDEWTTAIVRAKVEPGERNRDEIGEMKVCFSLILCCFHGSRESQEILCRLNVAERIGDLRKKIASINKRKNDFGLVTTSSEDLQWRNTTSELGVVVYGQDEEKRSLIKQLNEMDEKIRFISITGMGGIGKTTLAKNVYNDEGVKRSFRRRVWVCVSQPFNFEQIAREIVEQLTGRAPGASVGTETLMQRFREAIGRRKILLILDDVWTENYKEWEPLALALNGSGENGNRVIVTTRTDNVVRMIGEERVIRVKQLSEDDCWLLLKEVAFGQSRFDADLEPIGKQIALKCDGLPLAAKTLGGILRVKWTKEEWLHVLESELWELDSVEENLFRPLLLSYYDLRPVERRCFLYCAVFPKDHRMNRDDLVHQWMAQGYFYSNKQADIESIGQECFRNLALRSLFQDFDYDDVSNLTIKSCMMHDIVHDFAQSLTRGEFDVISVNDAPERLDFRGRHLSLTVRSDRFNSNLIPEPKRLHTLVVSMHDVSVFLNGVSTFKSLRSLSLCLGYGHQLPNDIGELIHLRYLCLSAIALQITLPATINDLFNLQTLRLGSSATLPPQMGKLVNLRHLCSPIDDREFPWPEQIGKLGALQTMEVVWCGDGAGEFHLRHLGNLNDLRRLRIQGIGRTQADEESATGAKLSSKTKLHELELNFWIPNPNSSPLGSVHKLVLETLKPCESLRDLRINNYGGDRISPSWMGLLVNLVRLELTECHSCKSLPPLGELRSLELLTICGPTSLESLGDEFLGAQSGCHVAVTLFPKLKKLKLNLLGSLLRWSGRGDASMTIMPLIDSLFIIQCSSLGSLPEFLETTPLKTLVIDSCPVLAIACQDGTGSEWHKIHKVPDIQILQ